MIHTYIWADCCYEESVRSSTCSKSESLPYAPHPIEIIIRMKGVLKELVIERERYRPTKAAPTKDCSIVVLKAYIQERGYLPDKHVVENRALLSWAKY